MQKKKKNKVILKKKNKKKNKKKQNQKLVLAFTAAIGSLSAQNYIVVNSEKVFKSIDEYNKALDTLDQLAKSYQQQVDLKFEEVEALYNNYKAQEMSLSASSRQARQDLNLKREEEACKFQEENFGQEGTLIKFLFFLF